MLTSLQILITSAVLIILCTDNMESKLRVLPEQYKLIDSTFNHNSVFFPMQLLYRCITFNYQYSLLMSNKIE